MKPCSSFIEDIAPKDTLSPQDLLAQDFNNVPGREKPVVLPKTLTVSNVQAALGELGK